MRLAGNGKGRSKWSQDGSYQEELLQEGSSSLILVAAWHERTDTECRIVLFDYFLGGFFH